jgi:hypothetical protein
MAFLLGATCVVLMLTSPKIPSNLWAYYNYYQLSKANLSSRREGLSEALGKPFTGKLGGTHFRWVFALFIRMAPVHVISYGACLLLLVVAFAIGVIPATYAWEAVAVLLLSLSPVLYGQITHSGQYARTYYPGFIGLALWVGYVAFQLDKFADGPLLIGFWVVSTGIMLLAAGSALWMFVDDLLPSRMAPVRLEQTLRTFGVKDFYTYDTQFNDSLLGVLPPAVRGRYKVHFIDRLQEVDEGYVVIPGTSGKSHHAEMRVWARHRSDFNLDPELTRLLQSKSIERYAVSSFKTIGSSRFWGLEGDLNNYCDLVFKDISDEDRWRGRAWILDGRKLQAGLRC